MTFDDAELMAFTDGELDAARRRAIERALPNDAALRARIDALTAQRRRVAAAFDSVLHEPVPDRLSALLARPAPAPVADLAAGRARRAAAAPPRMPLRGWAQWGGMAASLALGVIVGLQWPRSPGGEPALLAERGGEVMAGGALARALETRLAGDPPADIAVQLSFVDRAGRYCRTFSTDRLAGLACRSGAQWTVLTATRAGPAAGGTMRQAGSTLPRAVLEALDARIAGTALDAAQERQAREQGWTR